MSAAPYPPYPPFPPYAPYPPFPASTAYAPCAAGSAPASTAGLIPATTALAPAAPVITPVPGGQPVPAPQPFPGSDEGNPLSIFFNFDSPTLVDQTNEGRGTAQFARLQAFASQAQGVRATVITINGFASPEGDANHNATLARNRAASVRNVLGSQLPGITINIGVTGTLAGDPSSFPNLRRADVFISNRA
jgi:outer membrane protein OmpA-like peptidoglycan-associated protein